MSATIDSMFRPAAGVLAAFVLVAGCSSPVGTPGSTTGSTPANPTPPVDGRPTPTPVDTGIPTGQTDTEWGPIWNEVPPGFPEPAGSEPAEADSGPVSAAYAVPAAAFPNPLEVAQFYVDRFAYAGYGGSRDGPLEDGSYTAWASNGYGCDILVTAVPRGDAETLATVFYGAGCPFSWPAE